MKKPIAGQVKHWMYVRDQEIFDLIEAILEPYHIQDQDTLIELGGAMNFNTFSARLHNRFYFTSSKKVGETVNITIPNN